MLTVMLEMAERYIFYIIAPSLYTYFKSFKSSALMNHLHRLTRILARWVQAIIPPLNSFYFKSARKSGFLVFHDRKFLARLAREARSLLLVGSSVS